MPRITVEIDESEKERLEKLGEMLNGDLKDIGGTMISFTLNGEDRQVDWMSYFSTRVKQDIKEAQEEAEMKPDFDLNEGVRPETTSDLPGSDPTEEDLEEAQNQTEPMTEQDLEEQIDSLPGDENNE